MKILYEKQNLLWRLLLRHKCTEHQLHFLSEHKRQVYRINTRQLSFSLLALWRVDIFIVLSSSFYACGLRGHSFLHGSEAQSQFPDHKSAGCELSPLYTPKKWAGYWVLWQSLPPERKLSYCRAALRTWLVPTFAAQKISTSFHQLLATPQTPQVKSPWHFRIVEAGNLCLSSSVQASSLQFQRNYNWFSPWEMCHLHGRKGYLWAGKAQGRTGICQGLPWAATCPSASSPARGHWHRRTTKQSIDSDRCRCAPALLGMTNSIRAFPDDAGVNLGPRNRRNSKHIAQIQGAAMPLLHVLLHWSDQVFKADVSCHGY